MSKQTIDKMAFDIRAGRLSPYKIAVRIEELEAENERLRKVLSGIREMANEDIREGEEGTFTYQIEADARFALETEEE